MELRMKPQSVVKTPFLTPCAVEHQFLPEMSLKDRGSERWAENEAL